MKETKKSSKSIFEPEKSVRFFMVSVIGFSVVAMIIWPLMELIYTKFTNSSYTWTVFSGIVEPCIFGFIITVIEFLTWNLGKKKGVKS